MEQLQPPAIAEPPDPGPRPDRNKAVPVERKPPERAAGSVHPRPVSKAG